MASQTFNEALQARAGKLIDEHIKALSAPILAGHLKPKEYRRQTGMIAGLEKAKELISDAYTEAMKA